MDVVIKNPESGDLDAFINLYLELTEFNAGQFEKHHVLPEVVSVREERGRELFEESRDKDYVLLIMAYLKGKPVGFAHARIYDFKLRVGHFEEMFVREDARGLGIGEELLDRVMDWMNKKNLVRIFLSVYAWNENARRFYKKHGFDEYAVNFEKKIG